MNAKGFGSLKCIYTSRTLNRSESKEPTTNTTSKTKKRMNMTSEGISENLASELKENRWGMRSVVSVALAVWLAIVFALGSRGAFVGPEGSPPLAIFLGLTIPLAVFFATYFRWSAFRAFILGADLRLVAAIQGWRWAGLGFLSLYAHGILPGLFAFPAGLGDMAIGFTAPWMVLGLARQREFAASPRFVTWNILGILDLVVAVSMGTISSGFLPGLTGNVTSSAMAQLPLVLVPAYLVPFFIMLHFTALAQARSRASVC